MKTYQDFLKVKDNDKKKLQFVQGLISEHKDSEMYKFAKTAREYFNRKNTTITTYQKLLYDVSGKAHIDNFSANFKMASGFFQHFVTQEVQHLLSNGATFTDEDIKKKLGEDVDTRLQDAATDACIERVSFVFFNVDHLEVFKFTEFAPLYDEENGALMAGVKFWQIDDTKPMRATLYEIDGITGYIWNKPNEDEDGEILYAKKPYIVNGGESRADGFRIYNFENYPTFPIVPLWGNRAHQSELVGLREQIDCYDLIKSGFANDIDDASLIYWTIQNAGGMDDIDLREFVERMKTVHAANLGRGQVAESHSVEVPYAGREVILNRIKTDLYRDAMALDVEKIASGGAVTATQIEAAFAELDEKCDGLEYCVLELLKGIKKIAGIDENERVTFTRPCIVNVSEMVNNLIAASQITGTKYTLRKILELFGDGDQFEEIMEELATEGFERLTTGFEESGMGGSTFGGAEADGSTTENAG